MRDKGIVISLCDLTTNMTRPWFEAGYTCICVDLQHDGRNPYLEHNDVGGKIYRINHDVLRWNGPNNKVEIAFAFPSCQNLAVSGARWFQSKGMQGLIDALTLVERCRVLCESWGAPYMIENPISTLSTYWRKPDYKFDPCDFGGYLNPPGDAYTKKTCLWTGNGFIMPEPKRVEPVLGSKMHLLPPSDNRANLRSETPMGFARAVFEANHND